MATHTSVGPARKLHLDRAARNAGEAFAFHERDAAPATQRMLPPSLVWLSIAAIAMLGLGLAF